MSSQIVLLLNTAKENLEKYIPTILKTPNLEKYVNLDNYKDIYEQILKELSSIIDVYIASNPISALESLINQANNTLQSIIQRSDYNISNRIEITDYDEYYHEYLLILNNLELYLEQLVSIRYLCRIGDENTVIVGKNGSGKSSFASFFKNSFNNNIVVIPAQKYLVYKNLDDNQSLSMSRDELYKVQYKNYISGLKSNDFNELDQFLFNAEKIFTNLIITLCNEELDLGLQALYSQNPIGLDNSLVVRINEILDYILPQIKIKINSFTRSIEIIRNNQSYTVNAMSDGEKVALYYILHVILASKESYIIVDEPETFLNSSISNRLWNILEVERSDCKFLYLTHNIDFIMSRKAAKLLWCVRYLYPYEWELVDINIDERQLPKDVIITLLGSQKTILFCEGKYDEVSDYSFYSSLFGDKVFVYPVGGHKEVIQYVRKFNSSLLNGYYNAVGIIDHDFLFEETIEGYLKEKIFTLPFNEIEMALLCDELLENVVSLYADENTTKDIIASFKEEAFELLKLNKDKIVSENVKYYIEKQITTYKITNAQDFESIAEGVYKWLNELKEKDLFKIYDDKINFIIDKRDYNEFLKISSLKAQLSKGLANKKLESNYLAKAIQRVNKDVDLRELLIEKYFKTFKDLINED
ncbi:MAG: hypothetical protein KH398_02650 [Veillonella sp.]|uniref:hypothetical protein n=1 Tax=Veillonella sp. TaxID=1926307 RepID=UPI001D90D599|nr:hypothetical protein [Veillonella sp.]MBS6391686.1 hypothetical protein [Veillonella sp.]